ncbi:hypothetical protein BDC45DRAFT_601107, partial [Circinella umbellata]
MSIYTNKLIYNVLIHNKTIHNTNTPIHSSKFIHHNIFLNHTLLNNKFFLLFSNKLFQSIGTSNTELRVGLPKYRQKSACSLSGHINCNDKYDHQLCKNDNNQ